MGCRFILLEPEDVGMSPTISLKVRPETTKRLGVRLLCDCYRLSALVPETERAIMPLILDAHHPEILPGYREASTLPSRNT